MIYRLKILLSIFIAIIFSGVSIIGQEVSSNIELQLAYEDFDVTLGLQNTNIFTGIEYIEKHRMVNEMHKFYVHNKFLPATVFYEGQPYYNIPVKYNIFEDILLVNLPSQRGETNFQLLSNRLDGFLLLSTRFVNIYEESSDVFGIHEVLYETPGLEVLKKHRLSMRKNLRRDIAHYEFKPQKPKYIFRYKGNFYEVSRKNLLEVFPQHRPEVRAQYTIFRKQREIRDEVLVAMFQKLSKLQNDIAQ